MGRGGNTMRFFDDSEGAGSTLAKGTTMNSDLGKGKHTLVTPRTQALPGQGGNTINRDTLVTLKAQAPHAQGEHNNKTFW